MSVIEVRDLRKTYSGRTVLDGVSFSVDEGEVFGILGPNGAGKTTTVESIEGLRRPDSGTIRVLGHDPLRDGAALREQIGVQLQQSQLPDALKVWEALDLYASFYAAPRDWRQLLDEWGLTEQCNARFGTLSGGQKQRLFIALALVGDPKVAFLDELTTGLDPQARRNTWALIKRIRDSGVTTILVSHHMDEVEELCDRVAVIDRGVVAALDTPAGLVQRSVGAARMRFTLPAGAADPMDLVAGVAGVSEVVRDGDRVSVTGHGEFASAVTATLAAHRVLVTDLRIDRRSLEDAFIAITGRPFDH
ncbi:MAG TPA: ABC transporter ATP-binding protein [Candidatus Stackebrandtia excrementipullorum]|nr:ABC transporter ATP-binding protein [Candidatus Stackebrandtia excrementipullorum]